MSKSENSGFLCEYCGSEVLPLSNGSYRNHCPSCLYSLHVDIAPGDRASNCQGLMRPVRAEVTKKGWQILHKCEKCGFERMNIRAEDNIQPDDLNEILKLF